eukprot:m.264679 g.264679  ORF g.264679 m.264679 type:complete len:50 (+) comp15620_c1_seq1:196-345(+)
MDLVCVCVLVALWAVSHRFSKSQIIDGWPLMRRSHGLLQSMNHPPTCMW